MDQLIVSRKTGRTYCKPVARVVVGEHYDMHYPPDVRPNEIVEQFYTASANPKTPRVTYVQTFRTARHGDPADERVRWSCGCPDSIIHKQSDPDYACKHLSEIHRQQAAARHAQRCESCTPYHSAEEKQRAYEEGYGG